MMRKKMPNKSARYYMGKVLTVLEWIKAGKSEELRECGKIDGRCAEIVRSQVEIINEVKHIISDPETLNVYFAMATKKQSPKESVPNLFKQLGTEERLIVGDWGGVIKDLESGKKILEGLDFHPAHTAIYVEAINKAIGVMKIASRFMSKDKAHDQMIKDRLEGD